MYLGHYLYCQVQNKCDVQSEIPNVTSPFLKAVSSCQRYVLNTGNKLECGIVPNVMAALPNIGGALCSTPQSLANAHY